MLQERLDPLLLLFVEQELIANVDTDAVIDKCIVMENRQISL